MVDAGRLDATALIDAQAMVDAGVLTHVREGVRLLAKGSLTAKVTISVAGASAAANVFVPRTVG